MSSYFLKEADDGKHKFVVITPFGKKIKFGDIKYEDYTTHRDQLRKYLYISRHQKNEDWYNLNTKGAWSKNLLWNKKTLKESIQDMNNKFGINIIMVK